MMRFDKFTERAQEAAQRAAEIIQRYGHNQIDTEHILLALIEQPGGTIPQILEKLNVSTEALVERLNATLRALPKAKIFGGGSGQIFITPRVKRIIDLANEEANRLKDEYISTEHMLLSILTERNTPASRILDAAGLSRDRVYDAVISLRGEQPINDPQAESYSGELKKYSRDLTQLAREGKIDYVVGRDKEVLRLMRVLSNRTRNNPILVGDNNSDRIAIIEGLAQRIVANDVPKRLSNAKLIHLDFAEYKIALDSNQEFDKIFLAVIEQVQKNYDILVVDNFQELGNSGATLMSTSNHLKLLIIRGEIQIIGTTTIDGYNKYIASDALLERHISVVPVEEVRLSVDETLKILYEMRDRLESHHKVRFSDDALVAAAGLADRYITDRRFPDKAIDLMDEAASKLRMNLDFLPPDLKAMKIEIDKVQSEEERSGFERDYERAAQKKADRLRLEKEFYKKHDKWESEHNLDEVVEMEDIASVVHEWTGIPISQITLSEEPTNSSQRIKPKLVSKREIVNYLDFNLIISSHEKAGSYKVHVYQSPAGEAKSEFIFPLSDVEIENLVLRLLKLRSATRRVDSPEMNAARRLGTALFQSVFQGQVRDIFRISLQKVRSEKNCGLRMKLRLQDVPELANLPWEFLFDSDLQSFLAQSIQTPIVRYMELAETASPLKVILPLQVLAAISNPSDYADLDAQKEKESLQKALEPLISAGMVNITWLENTTFDSLRRSLASQSYHVLHFIGHGGLDKRMEQGVLVFTNNQNKGVWVDAERLGVLLYDHPSLRLVVLNSCEGARNTINDPFSSVATTLIRKGIPAVVAMQFEISDTAAVMFAADFYASLAAGFPVDAAIAEARKAVYFIPNDIEWGTPVLYLRAPDGVLFEFPK